LYKSKTIADKYKYHYKLIIIIIKVTFYRRAGPRRWKVTIMIITITIT